VTEFKTTEAIPTLTPIEPDGIVTMPWHEAGQAIHLTATLPESLQTSTTLELKTTNGTRTPCQNVTDGTVMMRSLGAVEASLHTAAGESPLTLKISEPKTLHRVTERGGMPTTRWEASLRHEGRRVNLRTTKLKNLGARSVGKKSLLMLLRPRVDLTLETTTDLHKEKVLTDDKTAESQ